MRSLIFISIFLPCWLCNAEAAVDSKNAYVMCRSHKTVRTIRIDKSDGQCRTVYTKEGVDKEVGSAKNPDSCQKILGNIRRNLENASWNCRDVSSSGLTQSNDQ